MRPSFLEKSSDVEKVAADGRLQPGRRGRVSALRVGQRDKQNSTGAEREGAVSQWEHAKSWKTGNVGAGGEKRTADVETDARAQQIWGRANGPCAGTCQTAQVYMPLDQHGKFVGSDLESGLVIAAQVGLVITFACQVLNSQADVSSS